MIYQVLEKIIKNFTIEEERSFFPLGDLVVDQENYIYNPHNNHIIGVLDEEKVYLNNEEVIPFKENWIAKKYDNKN